LPDADFILEQAIAIVVSPETTLADAVIASREGRIVYVGPAAEAATQVTRLPRAMRIDASGCTVRPSAGPLAVGAPLDALITKGDDPQAVRMEIAGGKIVRWT
jgi:hypothetical protein